jgi:HTH-type transcriptional repressor of NAD biosynthesis genes
MIKAFVFGKFLPFHKGHEAMIKFALTKCDFLTVLVCCSDKETISDEIRCSWIKKSTENEQCMEVKPFKYIESELPNSSESSEKISEIWATVFKKIFPDYSILITSEPYGNFVAKYMEIQHIAFDYEKKQFPVSATLINNDLFSYWNYLPDAVKQYFSIKIVILGTESTGKTVLTKRLSDYFKCSSVSEVGRELIANSNLFDFEDLRIVAEEHSKRIEKTITGNSPLVIIDTDIHITKSYSRFSFNRELETSIEIDNANKSDLYLYLNNDCKFVQDGTRLNEFDRNRLDLSHRLILKEHRIEYIEIKGDWDSRFELAIKSINELIEKKAQDIARGHKT